MVKSIWNCFRSGIIVQLYNPFCMSSFFAGNNNKWKEHKGYKVLLQLSMPYNYTLRHAVKFHINITSTENNYKANVNLTGGKH